MAHCLSSVGDYIYLCNTLPTMCRRMSAVMLLTMEIMSTFLRLIANNLLPVLHTACPLWGNAKGKRTIAAPQYDKTVSPFQNIL